MLSLYYLEQLCMNLHSIGFHHSSIHVMLLMTYVAGDIICNKSLLSLMHMKSCDLYQKLQMMAAYDYHQQLIDQYCLTEEDQAK